MGRFGEDMNRDRWRDNDRDDNRGFFERAGDEVRSWFSDDDDRNDRWRDNRSSWDRDRDSSRMTEPRGSFWDRDRSFSQSGGNRGYGRGNWESEGRSTFGGMSQGGLGRSGGGWDRDRGRHEWSGEHHQRFGSSKKDFGGFRDEDDFRSHRGRGRDHPQSWGEANRGENDSLGYSQFGGTLGGFGNQTFGSSQDDHYRSWRDRQMSELDRDYEEYCREREQQFHQDFGAWRSSRQSPSALGSATAGDTGVASNAGVGTTTSSVTGTAGSGSAIGSPTGTRGSSQSDTAGSTESAGASGGRSGSRSGS